LRSQYRYLNKSRVEQRSFRKEGKILCSTCQISKERERCEQETSVRVQLISHLIPFEAV
jgi:uncharacterized Zn finger protein (UPF0148 family)